jgi:AcrR family transcriptional regulator
VTYRCATIPKYGESVVVPPARDGDAQQTRREQILEAARAAIEEYGPDALTGQIAQRAGLARPNVYRHFSSKDDLDQAVARRVIRELRAVVSDRLDLSGGPLEVIRAPIEAQVTWADGHPNLYRFLVSRGLYRFLAVDDEEQSSEQRSASRSDFAAELAAAGAAYFPRFAENPAAAEAVVIGLAGFVDASIVQWLWRRGETRSQLINRLTARTWLLIDHHLRESGVVLNPVMPLPQPEQASEFGG